MPRKTEKNVIKEALAKMKIGQTKTVRVGPGREGRVLLKKGSPPSPKFVNPNVKSRAKVIRRKS